MIKAVSVTNYKGETLRMELANPWSTGIIIYEITGIDGGQANVNTSDLATGDGAYYNSAHLQSRNIVISMKPIADPMVETNRHKIYRYFPVKRAIHLEFETDERDVQIDGYVESNSTAIFSSQETAQISIICPDPYFYEIGADKKAYIGVQPGFEFPFSNESLHEPLLEFGIMSLNSRTVITYTGDAETGLTITIHALGDAEYITILNTETREQMVIDTDKINTITGSKFALEDDIIISTKQGSKSALLLRKGVYYNIIGAINRDADWFQLSAGDNLFAFTCRKGDNQILMTFSYHNTYVGV